MRVLKSQSPNFVHVLLVLSAALYLRYHHGRLGVVHDVILMIWKEITAISAAVRWA